MHIVTRTYQRPNINIPFFEDLKTRDNAYIIRNFVQNGKFVSSSKVDSADGLTRTYTRTWLDEDSYLEFISDQIVFKTHVGPKVAYNKTHGIITIENP